MVQDPATAEDLAQEVFVKAFRRLGTYDPQWKFSSWLFKIAHNTTIDHLRRGAPETVPLETAWRTTGEPRRRARRSRRSRAPRRRRSGGTWAARSSAPSPACAPSTGSAVLMFYAHGASYQEICEATGLPLGTVKTNLHRARKELAQVMSGLGLGTR